MGYNKTIQMCIFEGNPNGRILCELSNWDGRIYKISRSELNEFSKRYDSEYTGIYFLFGKNSDNDETIYIGEAEKMLTRLKLSYIKHHFFFVLVLFSLLSHVFFSSTHYRSFRKCVFSCHQKAHGQQFDNKS